MDGVILLSPLIFIFIYSITQHFFHKLHNLPPTPFPTLPFIGHIYFFTKSIPFHRALSHLSCRHGPLLFLRLGSRPVLLVSSSSAAQECLITNDVVFANRPNLLNGKHFGYDFTSLAWASYGDHWRNLRRISALHLLSSNKLDMLARVRAAEARTLVQKLLRDHNNGCEIVDMKTQFFEYTYNVVTRMIAGRGGSREEAQMFEEIVREMSRVTLEANVVDFLPFVGRLFGFRDVERKMRSVQEKRDRFMQNVIEDRCGVKEEEEEEEEEIHEKKRLLIQVLLDLQTQQPQYYTHQTIKNLFLVLVQGASHTSSNTLEWAFSHLLQNPEIQSRARSEIDNLVGNNRLMSESDISKLPYLRSILNETLRMHPPAPLLTPHISSQDCTVAGYHVPRGTMLLVNAWDIQNDPQTWKDPGKFMPERFEDGVAEGFEFVPFGLGRRACPGVKLAKHMVGMGLGCLIQCFEWEKIGDIDMKEGIGVITPRMHPLRAKCVPRPFLHHILS